MSRAFHSPSSRNRRQAVSVSPPKGSPVHGEGKISLRVDQPVEGCQMMTHAFFRSVEGDIDDQVVDLEFRWYRSSLRRACANAECPRHGDGNVLLLVAKLECVVCCRLGITREHSCFCSAECFRLAWHKHKQLHDKMATLESAEDKMPWKSHLYNVDALCPVQEDPWIEIANQQCDNREREQGRLARGSNRLAL
jgi:CCR4-NOT transcription complex subunit 6